MATAVAPAPPAAGPKRQRKPYARKLKPPKDADAAPSRRPPRLPGPLPNAPRIPGSTVLFHIAPRESSAPPSFRLSDCLEKCDFDLVLPDVSDVLSALSPQSAVAPSAPEASTTPPAQAFPVPLPVAEQRAADEGDGERDLADFGLRDGHHAAMDPLSLIAFEELREASAGWL